MTDANDLLRDWPEDKGRARRRKKVLNAARLSLLGVLALSALATHPALAGSQADPVDCAIENLTPQIPVGAQASYVVHLSGGLGTYSVQLVYGDGGSDSRAVNGAQATFTHLFSATGTYMQTAYVSGAGSNATCGSSTVVY